MSKEITNQEILKAIQGVSEQVAKNTETLTEVRSNLESLGSKVDGISNRFDTEILRSTDKHVDHEKRIKALEVKTGLAEPASS